MESPQIIYGPKFEKKIETLKQCENELIHVISDFDKTLTYAHNQITGEPISSVISILYNNGYLSKQYSEQAKALENYYIPIEKDTNISINKKKEKMKEWRERHYDILIKCGLNKKHIDNVVNTGIIKMREGYKEFFNILHKINIPIIIFSSAGLGTYSISKLLKNEGINYDNISIVSNDFKRDEKGNAITWTRPVITSYTKDENTISKNNFPNIFNKIKNKTNIILLGDSIGDVHMASEKNGNTILRIGFLNENNINKLEQYKKEFDMILLGDKGLYPIIETLQSIFL